MPKYTARDIAEYFLCLSDPDSGDLTSNLKLQKLVYYAQGIHLADTGEPLFGEQIVAWEHGPVVAELYRTYKQHGSCHIAPDPEYDISKIDENTRCLLDEVYRVLGQYSAWKLREMTHQEPPWLNAHGKGSGTAITHSDMKAYFKAFIKAS